MTEDAAVSIAVVCEAPADQRMAAGLTDNVLCAHVDWITAEIIHSYRCYRGINPSDAFLKWSSVPAEAARRKIKAHGWFAGQPGAHDAHSARKALLVLQSTENAPQAVLLVRDTDGDQNRVVGLTQARNFRSWGFKVIIGAANPKRECWLLAAFEPRSQSERRRLQAECRELQFDPCSGAARLTAKSPGAKRNAKRVCKALLGGDLDREADCWNLTDLSTLEQKGKSTGLDGFLHELRELLVPLFAPVR